MGLLLIAKLKHPPKHLGTPQHPELLILRTKLNAKNHTASHQMIPEN